jgi:lipid-A-disaccharide synthase
MAKVIDHVLALLPFEPPYMTAHGMACDFVGHPVATETAATLDDIAAFRAAHGLGNAPFVLVLPGSRRSEVERLMPVFGDAVAQFLQDRPDTKVVLPVAQGVSDPVQQLAKAWPVEPVLLGSTSDGTSKIAAFAGAEIALAASGTVSLELAKARTPMVIAYTFHWLTWHIMRRMALIDTVTLVNLVSETRDVPECLGPDCTPGKIARALKDVANAPEAQRTAMETTMSLLGEGGDPPGVRAARAVLARFSG